MSCFHFVILLMLYTYVSLTMRAMTHRYQFKIMMNIRDKRLHQNRSVDNESREIPFSSIDVFKESQ